MEQTILPFPCTKYDISLSDNLYHPIKDERLTFFVHKNLGFQTGDIIRLSAYGYPTWNRPILVCQITFVLSGSNNGIIDNWVSIAFIIEKVEVGTGNDLKIMSFSEYLEKFKEMSENQRKLF